MRGAQCWMSIGFGCALLLAAAGARAQGVEVTAHASIADKATAGRGKAAGQSKAGDAAHKAAASLANVVVWLSPLQPDARPVSMGHAGPFRLVQKDKMFMPHLLVVPTGSSVEFPNLDPFFHNVFSLFNGKPFDLGLYEPGTSRAVRFDREGVSYIFCNIHPEMGAVIVALSTPYWGVSTADGGVVIHEVPPGSYSLHVWSEAARSANPMDAERMVQVGAASVHLGEIVLEGAADPMENHKNKFGEDYDPDHNHTY
jgi:plastocyanin